MYKIIKDNYIIDVTATYLAENAKNHALINTTSDNAHFLLSSDKTTLYKAPWCYGHVTSHYTAIEVDAQKVDEEEFNRLKEELKIQPIPQEDKYENTTPEIIKEETSVLNVTKMQQKILELEALVQQLLNTK